MNMEKLDQLGGLQVDDETGRSVNNEDVRRVEQHIGSTLPEDYRAFLLRYGSGQSHFNESVAFVHAAHPDGACGINAFFGAVPLENFYCYDLISKYDETRGDLPSNTLAIADDGGGNYICLSVSGDDVGSVYYWNHEEIMDSENEPSYKYLQFVAASFTEFIGKLQIYIWD